MAKRKSITLRGEAANNFVQALIKEKEKEHPADILNTLFGLSVIDLWSREIYDQLRGKLELVLNYLEDGATETAKEILRELLYVGTKDGGENDKDDADIPAGSY